jgi:UDP-N-acetylmuramyl pentapeptide phosphotransferase/UDP-N-acetylglucosamine-1-phosphate transferase
MTRADPPSMKLTRNIEAKPGVLEPSSTVALIYGVVLWQMVARRITDALDGLYLVLSVLVAIGLGTACLQFAHCWDRGEGGPPKIRWGMLLSAVLCLALAVWFVFYVKSVPIANF